MSFRDDSYSFHYSGLDGLWKRVVIWGSVGVLCAFSHPVPRGVLGLLILGGAMVGVFTAWRVSRMNLKWIEHMRWAVLLLLLGYCINQGTVKSVLGYLAVGAFLSVTIDLVMAVLVPMALSKAEETAAGRAHFRHLQSNPPPLELDAPTARKAFLEALSPDLRAEMAKTFVTATIITPQSGGRILALESSSFGGQPFLQAGEPWPEYQGRPLKFLAQINFGEARALLPEGLPKHGLLSFFFDQEAQPSGGDPSELGAGRILYSSEVSLCESRAMGGDMLVTARQPLSFHHEIVQDEPDELNERFYTYYHTLKAGEKVRLSQLHECVGEQTSFDNRLFSTPGLIQNSMTPELLIASKAFGLPENTVWTMVLQLGSVDEQNWCWGDGGHLYFWVPLMDAQTARFDRSWAVIQCT
jgi:hypothetical protein